MRSIDNPTRYARVRVLPAKNVQPKCEIPTIQAKVPSATRSRYDVIRNDGSRHSVSHLRLGASLAVSLNATYI